MSRQVETIRNISDLNSLSSVVTNIASKSGLKEVKKKSQNLVEAIEERALGNRRLKFFCTLSALNSKLPNFLKEILENSHKDDEIIIVTTNRKVSDFFKTWISEELRKVNVEFWNEDVLVDKIDTLLPEYWGHNDLFLKSYEDSFTKLLGEESDLKQVLKLDIKFEKLLNIFIDPKIYYFKEDPETERQVRVKMAVGKYLNGNNYFISGDAGTGKSTLLKEIGKRAVLSNQEKGTKFLPIYIKSSDLVSNEFSFNKTIETILSKEFSVQDFDKAFSEYQIILLIDSIDEMEKEIQVALLKELSGIAIDKNVNYVVCTRNYDYLTRECDLCEHVHTMVYNFDQNQVKLYLDNFFKFDLAKSDMLWESLQENNILERIPTTPLTISLMSILYEENGYEVPATLTDVYDNFNMFLLGRLNVKNRFEFLEITMKERILSMYALDVIRTKNRIRKTKEEFLDFVLKFFSKKSITVTEELVPELLNSLTDGTGVLYIDDKDFISFKHDHFMEYYASREIFNHYDRNTLEVELIDNFTNFNWQNTAIFYSGRTKDMPEFLNKIIEKTKTYSGLNDCLLSVSGLGYLMQSMWLTDAIVRKDGVVAALELLIKADSKIKELASSKFFYFKGIRDIDIALMNLVWFYKHFNSVVLVDPLKLAYEHLDNNVKDLKETAFSKDLTTRLYQMFCIASTLNTGRNEDASALNQLFDEDKILNNPFFVLLFDNAIKILESSNELKLKEDYKLKSKIKKYTSSVRFYLDNSAEVLRHTTFERLNPIKEVELFTEGKTDASIIFHAHKVLTNGMPAYWSITGVDGITGKDGGGARELAKFLNTLSNTMKNSVDSSKVAICIFDNDSAGFAEFNGLNSDFVEVNGITKKHSSIELYALLLPIPEDADCKSYHQDKQAFKFFAIEHYFEINFLKEHKMVTESSIPGVYDITGDKSKFVDLILKERSPKVFERFAVLLHEIDSICKKSVTYIDS